MMHLKFMRALSLAVFALGLSLLTGCAQIKLGAPTPSAEGIQAAKASGMPATAVGDFTLSAGLPKSLDQGVDIRSNNFSSPLDNSLAKYLQETLSSELRAAGLLDPGSSTVISGQLTKSMVEAGMSQGAASLGARIKVARAGQTLFDKELVESDAWPSSFLGAVAIPEAANRYAALYRRLVARLLKDEEFRKAVKA